MSVSLNFYGHFMVDLRAHFLLRRQKLHFSTVLRFLGDGSRKARGEGLGRATVKSIMIFDVKFVRQTLIRLTIL